jgi:hypothetical protein
LAFFFGIFPAIEMIHAERSIYQRERMVNLKIPSYVLSKLCFLLAFGLWQAFSLSAELAWWVKAEVAFAPCFLLILSVGLSGASAGLLFSTVARSSKLALLLMLGWLVLMISFSGFVVTLPHLRDKELQWLLAPSSMRWGLGGLMDLVQDVPLAKIKFFGFEEEAWPLNLGVNFTLCLLALLLTMILLRLQERR